MNLIIKKIPLPMSGLMLALAATGNLLSAYGNIYRYSFGIAAAVILILLVIKAISHPNSLSEGFENPVVASVMPTFPMGMMIISTYFNAFVPTIALGIWVIGLLLHIILLICFTMKYVLNFSIKKVFPSYFIVYVGIVCSSISAPVFGLANIGRYIFWFGFASYLIMLPIVLYRVLTVKEIPEPALPTITILAAPSSLCLAGYLNSFPEKSMVIIVFLAVISVIMLISVLAYMPKLLKLKFYPSYSAFTFPFVITAIAMKGTYAFILKAGLKMASLGYLVTFLEIWSVAIVIYVLIKYISFLTSDSESTGLNQTKQA
jgi:exfoliative toxin A/B